MTKVKMCLQCNRLVNLDVVECSCGGKDFIEVILDFIEEEKSKQSTVQYMPSRGRIRCCLN